MVRADGLGPGAVLRGGQGRPGGGEGGGGGQGGGEDEAHRAADHDRNLRPAGRGESARGTGSGRGAPPSCSRPRGPTRSGSSGAWGAWASRSSPATTTRGPWACSRGTRGRTCCRTRSPTPRASWPGSRTSGGRCPRPGVLFATHDEALAAIGPAEDRLGAWFHRPWSPWPALAPILDKAHQHAVARAIGFPVPATVQPADAAEVRAAARELRFPVVLKPRDAPEFRRRFRAQVLEAATPAELEAAWERAAPYAPQISEVVPGGDERPLDAGELPGGRRAGRRLVHRPQAAPVAPALRHGPRGRGAAGTRGSPPAATSCSTPSATTASRRWRPSATRATAGTTSSRSTPARGSGSASRRPPGSTCPTRRTWTPWGASPRGAPAGHASGRRWVLLSRHLGASPGEIRRGDWTAGAFLHSLRPPIVDGVLDARDPRPAVASYSRQLARRPAWLRACASWSWAGATRSPPAPAGCSRRWPRGSDAAPAFVRAGGDLTYSERAPTSGAWIPMQTRRAGVLRGDRPPSPARRRTPRRGLTLLFPPVLPGAAIPGDVVAVGLLPAGPLGRAPGGRARPLRPPAAGGERVRAHRRARPRGPARGGLPGRAATGAGPAAADRVERGADPRHRPHPPPHAQGARRDGPPGRPAGPGPGARPGPLGQPARPALDHLAAGARPHRLPDRPQRPPARRHAARALRAPPARTWPRPCAPRGARWACTRRSPRPRTARALVARGGVAARGGRGGARRALPLPALPLPRDGALVRGGGPGLRLQPGLQRGPGLRLRLRAPLPAVDRGRGAPGAPAAAAAGRHGHDAPLPARARRRGGARAGPARARAGARGRRARRAALAQHLPGRRPGPGLRPRCGSACWTTSPSAARASARPARWPRRRRRGSTGAGCCT